MAAKPPGEGECAPADSRRAVRRVARIDIDVEPRPIAPPTNLLTMRHAVILSVALLPAVALAAEEPIFEKDAKLKVEAEKGVAGEGPAWDPKLGVLTSGNGHINRLDRDGKSSVYRKDAGTNGLLFDREGRLMACEPEKRRVTRTDPDGKVTVLTDSFDGKKYNTPNDLTIDAQGPHLLQRPAVRPEGRHGADGRRRQDGRGRVPHRPGRQGSPRDRPRGGAGERRAGVGGRQVPVRGGQQQRHEGGARKLWRFDLKDGDGGREEPEAALRLGHRPRAGRAEAGREGPAVRGRRAEQAEPAAEPDDKVKGGIYVLDPDGKLLAFLAVPTDEVTNCAFGGDDRKTLYVTGGGVLYSIRTTTRGQGAVDREEVEWRVV